jgi:N-acetyl-gamma-glutamyl-phosphate reductase
VKVGVVGASGYTGTELLRLCAMHPGLEPAVVTADTKVGERVGSHTPALAAAYPDLSYQSADPQLLDGLDVVFCALPHGASQRLVPALRGRVGVVVDLAADFRLTDPDAYPLWYGEAHAAPDLLVDAVYGLPELVRDRLPGASLIAAPGCYPTAACLALAPFVDEGLIEREGIIVDAASGTSGAGQGLSERLHFANADENFAAYGLLRHRHTPEIEQTLGASVLFTPHLAPMIRGILATCYARPTAAHAGLTTADAIDVLAGRYADEPFIVVTQEPPSTKWVSGSNCAQLTARVDERTGWVLVLCAIDNLVKGASGQAVQCANLSVGLPEAAGLPLAGLSP